METVVLSNDIKKAIITQEMTSLEAELYRHQLRHRVQKRLGNDNAIGAIEKDMEKTEEALDLYRKEYEKLENEAEDESIAEQEA